MRNNSREVVSSCKVFKGLDYLTFILLTLLSHSAVIWFASDWFCYGCFSTMPLVYIGLSAFLFGRVATIVYRWWQLLLMKRPVPIPVKPGWKVGVATTFVPGSEAIEMLEETIRALASLNYPHDTWVLDEGNDPQVKSLCVALGVLHFSRKDRPKYQMKNGVFQQKTKYGNYNSWLYEVGFDCYDIIVNFDPDHVPSQNFLEEVLGYFNDPDIGYVQVAQAYYNQKTSFIAKGAAEETYWYYSVYQQYCHSFGHPIVTGCHTAHRGTALKAVGGFASHDADDLLITFFYRALGWKGVYIPRILARGLTPVDWEGYLKQQLRWARSVLDIKLWIYPKIVKKFTLKERFISAMHGIHYLHRGISALVGIIMLAFMLFTGSMPTSVNYSSLMSFSGLWFILISCDLYQQKFFLDCREERGLHWRAHLLMMAKWPYFLLALCQAITRRKEPYFLTKKVGWIGKKQYIRFFWPHVIATGFLCAAWVGGIIFERNVHAALQVVAALTVSINLLLMSTAFMHFPMPYDPAISPYSRNFEVGEKDTVRMTASNAACRQ